MCVKKGQNATQAPRVRKKSWGSSPANAQDSEREGAGASLQPAERSRAQPWRTPGWSRGHCPTGAGGCGGPLAGAGGHSWWELGLWRTHAGAGEKCEEGRVSERYYGLSITLHSPSSCTAQGWGKQRSQEWKWACEEGSGVGERCFNVFLTFQTYFNWQYVKLLLKKLSVLPMAALGKWSPYLYLGSQFFHLVCCFFFPCPVKEGEIS